jgi:Branched-chain amino acid aminotransferase/4-amino-4-deoxychorismate lyase
MQVLCGKFLNFATMQAAFVNIDGKLVATPEAALPVDNRAFRYGWGLFETMLVRDGSLQLAAYHWQRLFDGLKQLCFDMLKLFTPAYLEAEVLRTVQKNKLEKLCRVRLQVYAGNGGILDEQTPKPQFLIECFEITQDIITLNDNGLTLGIAAGLQKRIDSLANLKTSSAIVYALAGQQAKQNKWNDVLLCNTHGNVIESTIANIWWVKDDIIYTPPLSEGCIAGVMRRHLLAVLPQKGFNVKEQALTVDELQQADAVFLTNAIRRIKWVGSITGKRYGQGLTTAISNTLT